MDPISVDNPTLIVPVVAPVAMSPDGKNVQATTSVERERVTSGQRRVNLIWETTQALIALSVTGALIYTSIVGKPALELATAFTLITAVYFVRMNHIKTGGVGAMEPESR